MCNANQYLQLWLETGINGDVSVRDEILSVADCNLTQVGVVVVVVVIRYFFAMG